MKHFISYNSETKEVMLFDDSSNSVDVVQVTLTFDVKKWNKVSQ